MTDGQEEQWSGLPYGLHDLRVDLLRGGGCACRSRETAAKAAERLLTSPSPSNSEPTVDGDCGRQERMVRYWCSHMGEDEQYK
ncbi:unnamed protein product [Haemonchus placei]|uniref:Uncharacterized protein n=1 Tax=Haemonchus placei TaxID=6290 RepID=A0A0N4W419_HAEPC|nr:unnamed protein product [Haemonchus placei]